MSIKQVPFEDATGDQLRTFAADYLGITFPANAKDETMRAKIKPAWGKDHIMINDEAGEGNAPRQEGTPPKPVTNAQQGPVNGSVRVIISVSDEPGGSDPVPLAVNGYAMLVPRGKEVDIPVRYHEALNNAVMDRYDTDADGNLIPIPRKVPKYPYNRVA